MILTKLEMSQSRNTFSYLSNAQKLHGLITGIFGSSQSNAHILFRTVAKNGGLEIFVYSDSFPVCVNEGVKITGMRDLSEWMDHFKEDDILRFDIITAPSKKVKVDGSKNSRRILIKNYDDRLLWWERKAKQNGFRIISINEVGQNSLYAHHSPEKGGDLHMHPIQYQGVLRIVDVMLFKKALSHGIGPDKAYGLGMMLIK